ncbi:DUF7716 domain-containing protein [Gilvimarinus polysaccharolyticus]|uniref:DUF7716 domain-containing protein n=1 Tax=Gilvimarinus polysaccharolyticus TaxID=863921 RepID=UPI000673BAAB|nr:hypothetical protein [Gilvimarinus polysaccharolyticus]
MRFRTTLKKLIADIEEYEWFFDVYVPESAELSADTKILIVDDDDEEERDEYDEPVFPKKIGFKLLMSISQLIDVVESCETEGLSDVIKTINDYYENHAFID